MRKLKHYHERYGGVFPRSETKYRGCLHVVLNMKCCLLLIMGAIALVADLISLTQEKVRKI